VSGAEYLLITERINSALNSINGFICSRPCCFEHNSIPSDPPQGHHTYIGFAKHIWDGEKFTEEQILNYENDTKHGVIHGVLCYVIACIINSDISENLNKRIENKNLCKIKKSRKLSNSPLELLGKDLGDYSKEELEISLECYNNPSEEEKLLTSCLTHDFLRCSFGAEDHDKNLIKYFPQIDNTALSHSSPSLDAEKHPLIRSDRLELLRFKKARDWIDEEKVLKDYSELQLNLIEIFYNTVRPVLEESHKHRNERWIRHGLERHVSSYEFEDHYPSTTIDIIDEENLKNVILTPLKQDDQYWSVELSKGSMGDCIVGQKTLKDDFEAFWQEPNTFFSWELVQGKIPLMKYRTKTGKDLVANTLRDHLFASGNLPISDWIFTHKNINSKMIEILLEKNIYFCHENIVGKFLKTCEKVIDVFYGIKMKL
jgi:hypothetical protein